MDRGEQRRGETLVPAALLRRSHGLWKSVGVPGFVDPADPTQLWIDWDAAYDEHEEAWERKGRIEREIAAREGGLEKLTHRMFNPLRRQAAPGGGVARGGRDRPAVRARGESRERAIAPTGQPVPPDEQAEQVRRIAQAERLRREGRKASAVVVSQAATGRTVGEMPVLLITLDVEDGGGTRRVTYEHIWGRRHAEFFGVGKRIKVRIDPDDPQCVDCWAEQPPQEAVARPARSFSGGSGSCAEPFGIAPGGSPNCRRYSRLNCDALSCRGGSTVATSSAPASSSRRTFQADLLLELKWARVAVTAWKSR